MRRMVASSARDSPTVGGGGASSSVSTFSPLQLIDWRTAFGPPTTTTTTTTSFDRQLQATYSAQVERDNRQREKEMQETEAHIARRRAEQEQQRLEEQRQRQQRQQLQQQQQRKQHYDEDEDEDEDEADYVENEYEEEDEEDDQHDEPDNDEKEQAADSSVEAAISVLSTLQLQDPALINSILATALQLLNEQMDAAGQPALTADSLLNRVAQLRHYFSLACSQCVQGECARESNGDVMAGYDTRGTGRTRWPA